MKHAGDYIDANRRRTPKSKMVLLENPWTHDTGDSGMTWAQILNWSKDAVHPVDLAEWRKAAKAAFDAGDSATLGAMILGR
jgi:hypothetical protein